LKKASDPHARNLVDKSLNSGVQIIGNLADVSSLLADKASSSPRNSGIFAANKGRNSSAVVANGKASARSSTATAGGRNLRVWFSNDSGGEDGYRFAIIFSKRDNLCSVFILFMGHNLSND
jgi:hypothetical protein